MLNQFSRTQLLIGPEAMEKLHNARVAVFGIGGVGGYTVEALVRSGIGTIDIIDDDIVCITNINRQIIATWKSIGKYKVDVMEERIKDISPTTIVNKHKMFFLPETAGQFDFSKYDYVVDAVDTVTAKISLVLSAQEAGIPIISCMGAANKMDPTKFEVADIYKTSVCPLAKVMRYELRKRGVKHLKVVFSTEEVMKPIIDPDTSCELNSISSSGTGIECTDRHQVPGSNAFVPSVAGMILAAEVVKDIINKNTNNEE